MYRIQSFNYAKRFYVINTCKTMQERDSYIKTLIDTNEYTRAGITWEWLARS